MNVLLGKRIRWSERRLTGGLRGKSCQVRANYIPTKRHVSARAVALRAGAPRWGSVAAEKKTTQPYIFNVFDSGLLRAQSVPEEKDGGYGKLCHTRPSEAGPVCAPFLRGLINAQRTPNGHKNSSSPRFNKPV